MSLLQIDSIKLGVICIMPNPLKWYQQLVEIIEKTGNVEIFWIRLKTHKYTSTDKKILEKNSISFEESIEIGIDCLLITGAPVENLSFSEVYYWNELSSILKYARSNFLSTLGLCWGGMAISRIIGINKTDLDVKLHGIFKTCYLPNNSYVYQSNNEYFLCPQSRWSALLSSDVKKYINKGVIEAVATIVDTEEIVIYETTDKKFLVHLGHPEYKPEDIVSEYIRDKDNGAVRPININIKNPVDTLKKYQNDFFKKWIYSVATKKYSFRKPGF